MEKGVAGVLAYAGVICIEMTIVYPSLYPRLQRMADAHVHMHLGLCLAGFSFGRAVCEFSVNTREHGLGGMRAVGSVCFVLSLAGSVLYLVANDPQWLLASRVVAGAGAGALSLMLNTLVSVSSEEKRTQAMSLYFLACASGNLLGPLLALLSTVLPAYHIGGVRVDEYSTPGLWMAVLFVPSFVLVFRSFNATHKGKSRDKSPLSRRLVSPLLVVTLLAGLVNNAGDAAWETVTVPLGHDFFGWGVGANSVLFIASGALQIAANILVVGFCERRGISDDRASGWSVVVTLAGGVLVLLQGRNVVCFCIGNALYDLGLLCLLTFLASAYSKTLTGRKGFFMAVYRSLTTISRLGANLLSARLLGVGDGALNARVLLVGVPVAIAVLLCVRWALVRASKARPSPPSPPPGYTHGEIGDYAALGGS